MAADTDGDGTANELTDVQPGDRVVVQVRLARGETLGDAPTARQVVDQGAPSTSGDDGSSTTTTTQGS